MHRGYAVDCELVVFIYNGAFSLHVTKDLEPVLSCIGGSTRLFKHECASECAPDKARGTTIHKVAHVRAILITRLAFYLMLLMLPASEPSLHLSSWVATIWRSASSSLVRRSNWSSYGNKRRRMSDQGTIKTKYHHILLNSTWEQATLKLLQCTGLQPPCH